MSAPALVRGALLGWWKITSFHVELEDTGECVDTYGVDPLGHMVITDDRMMSILTSRERTDKDAAALFETMMAYSGSCRIEDEVRLVIKVDAAWHPAWVGSEAAGSVGRRSRRPRARPGAACDACAGWRCVTGRTLERGSACAATSERRSRHRCAGLSRACG